MNKPTSAGLIRALGPVTATAVVIGTTIGSGVFKKPQIIAAKIDHFGLIALLWVLGGVLVALGALAYAEVSVLFPKAGGNYVFLREAYGRLPAFLYGCVEFLIIRTASIAALATVFAESLNDIIRDPVFAASLGLSGPVSMTPRVRHALTAAVILALGLVNVRGVKWGGGLQLAITLVKVGSLMAIVALPFVLSAFIAGAPGPQPANLTPVWPSTIGDVSFGKLGTAFLGVLWAYHGWMMLSPVAEEVTHPQRNLPIALLSGVSIIVLLYLGANLAYALVIPLPEIARLPETTTTAAEFGRRMLGPLGGTLASAAVMVSVFGALNGNLLAGPRVLFALGEDGLAPLALGRVHPRFHTPAAAILVESVWSALLVVGVSLLTLIGVLDPAKSHFDILTNYAMFGAVLFETLAVVSIFIFRWRLPDVHRPYRCPGYPVVPLLYTILPGLIVVNSIVQPDDRIEACIALGFVAVSAVAYWLLGLARTGPGYAIPPVSTEQPATGIVASTSESVYRDPS